MNATLKRKESAATTATIEIPPSNALQPHAPEFLRLPKPGQLCPFTGLSRSAINGLILPTEANGGKPPVRSFCLRQKGAQTGIRLVDYASLQTYIRAHEEGVVQL